MRLSCITDEISQDLGHALAVMSEYGIVDAELRNVYGRYIVDADESMLRRVAEDLGRHAMRVCCIDTPLYKCEIDDEAGGSIGATHGAGERTLVDQLGLLQHAIDLCRRFDTDLIRIFSFWRRGPLTPTLEERIAEALARPCQIAERAGVTLLLENEHACTLGTGAETARMVERIGSPALKMLWDPGNAYMAGETPFPAGWRAVAAHVAHVHVKDARAPAAGPPEWTCVGEGDIDYAGQFAALRENGYGGVVALETHWRGADADPEASSRACLAALRRMLDAA
ncbi:MAG: sugar phosphate isomerase/epimerase family protein [Armatimonadota bacterium]